MNIDKKLHDISIMLEDYTFEHLFDDDGILYAYTDVKAGAAFTSEFMSDMYLDAA